MLMHPTVSLHLLHSEGRENSSTRRTFLKFAKEKFVEISIDISMNLLLTDLKKVQAFDN